MITIKVKFQNGDHIVTGINTDLESAKKYYLGADFGSGTSEENETSSKAISVEEFEPDFDFWECHCEKNNVNPNRLLRCDKCGAEKNDYNVANKFEVNRLKELNKFWFITSVNPASKKKPYNIIDVIVLSLIDGDIKNIGSFQYTTGSTRGSEWCVMKFLSESGRIKDNLECYYNHNEPHSFSIKEIYGGV